MAGSPTYFSAGMKFVGCPLAALTRPRHPVAIAAASTEALLQRQPDVDVPVSLSQLVDDELGFGTIGHINCPFAEGLSVDRIVEVEGDRCPCARPIFDERRRKG